MHAYRTHNCGALRLPDAGRPARLSGWVHRKRDHGQLLFIDLRDHYGITQCVIDISSPLFVAADALRLESVVTMTGSVAARSLWHYSMCHRYFFTAFCCGGCATSGERGDGDRRRDGAF